MNTYKEIYGMTKWADTCVEKLKNNKFVFITGNPKTGKTTLAEKVKQHIQCGYMYNVSTKSHFVYITGKSNTIFMDLVMQLYPIFHEYTDLTITDIINFLSTPFGFHDLLDKYRLLKNRNIIITLDNVELLPSNSTTYCFISMLLHTIKPYVRTDTKDFSSEVYLISISNAKNIGELVLTPLVDYINKSMFLIPKLDITQVRTIIEDTFYVNDIEFEASDIVDFITISENLNFIKIDEFIGMYFSRIPT